MKVKEEGRGEERICQSHQEPLKLFCKDDQTPICVVCDRSKKHQGHMVLPIEEATQDYNKKIQDLVESLKMEKERVLELKAMRAARNKQSLETITSEMQRMACVFKQAHQFLEEQKQLLLEQWESLQVAAEEQRESDATCLSEDIACLDSFIEKAEGRWWQPESTFLQEMKMTLKRSKKRTFPEPIGIFSQLQDRLDSLTLQNTAIAKRMKKFKDSLSSEVTKSNLDFPVIAGTATDASSSGLEKEEASSPLAKRRRVKQVIATERNMKLEQPQRGLECFAKPFFGSLESKMPSPASSSCKKFSMNNDVKEHHENESSSWCSLS
ncbi:zinc finger protein RFP-like isoform X2 [Sceloporus undulatus]|uniref:zinc finger protein RFP-like isoform X2 n=1 Tax=Sceloporus undulatus TaxID=8520 RepID=UPI001C4CEF69|nr:zinc finger protein RFP-like isoform X2 [Sceloporus undulatus]